MGDTAKDQVQRSGLNKWWSSGRKGTLQYATGVGKTRCGVIAASHIVTADVPEFVNTFDNEESIAPRILIITPTETIRDQVWKNEFKKWGHLDIFKNYVEMVCIQTAWKYEDQHYDLVIADEVHNYITPQYFKFFVHNTCSAILGLSAKIPEDKLEVLNTIAPIIDTMTTNDALDKGLISPFKIYNVGLDLTDSEKTDYIKSDALFRKVFPLFNRDINLMFQCLNKGKYLDHLSNKGIPASGDVMSLPYKCKNAMTARKNILYNAMNKLGVIKLLSDKYSDRMGIVFSQTIEFADKITEELGDVCVSFHSKMTKTQKKANFKRLNDGRTKVTRISAAKALNEGVDVPKISLAIIASGTSKSKDWIQRLGRSVRWEEGKQAIIIRLFIKDSQEEKWLNSSQTGYEVEFIDNLNDIE
tara:strand:- start:17322 stop:18566 length:1245 start_codon:yes stop_codon:yes gene_type:complete